MSSVTARAAQTDSGVQRAASQSLPDLPPLNGKLASYLCCASNIVQPVLTYHMALYADQYQDKVKFTPYANWLIPGHLMVGRYPYVEPSRCP